MQRMIFALVIASATACGDSGSKQQPTGETAAKADDCKLFLGKARGTFQRLATAAGVTWSQSMEDTALADCREDLAAGRRAAMIDCVLQAKSEPEVQGCFPRYEELTAGKLGSGSG